jgi:membrane associated rhomboid family serine protease
MLSRIFSAEILILVAIIWIVFIIELVVPGVSFQHFGILPRKLEGLKGILFSPFLHGGLSHIVSNTVPLLVLTALMRVSPGPKKMFMVLLIGAVGSGLGTWIFSSGDVVIGASGVVFALIGFLFADAWFSPSLRSWAVAISAFVLYGGALSSIFVYVPFISWAAHFWGLISGVASAIVLKK